MLTIPCWITKTDGESLAEILRKGSSREEAAVRPRQLWIHIGASHHFDSSVPHCSESSQITSATACASVFKGTTLFVPEGRLFLAGYSRRHECSESSGKNPAEGQTRHAGKLPHCSLLRAIVFKNEPVPANGDRPRRRGSSLQTLF